MKDFLTLAKERYSVRAYKDTPVEVEKIERILTAGKLAPTAKNNQPQKIYVVQSEEKRKALAAITTCTFGAPVVFVIAYDDMRSAKGLIYDEYDFGTMDASIVCTHMMLEAAEQGLGSCWVGRFAEDDAKKVLGLGEHIHVRALLPVGYAAGNAVPSDRHEEYRDDTVEYM